MLAKVESLLEAFILDPTKFEPAQIEEIKQVGSHRMGTMVAGLNSTDLVVILKTLPTEEAVTALAARLLNDYRTNNQDGL